MTTRAPQMLNVDQVAARLGTCPKTVRRRIKDGELHFHRVGRLIRVSEDDLAAFVAQRRR